MRASALRGAVVGTCLGLLAFGGVASAALWAGEELRVPVEAGRITPAETVATVEGDLYPGRRNPLTITFTNPNPVPTHVTGLTVDRFTGDLALTAHLVAAPVLAPDGHDPATGEPRPLLLPAHGSVTVTVPDAVGLADDAHADARPIQGAEAVIVLRATYTAVPGDETAPLER